jgi:hypothetical protein
MLEVIGRQRYPTLGGGYGQQAKTAGSDRFQQASDDDGYPVLRGEWWPASHLITRKHTGSTI